MSHSASHDVDEPPRATCPHYDAPIIGAELPRHFNAAATRCPTCGVWVERTLRIREPRDGN